MLETDPLEIAECSEPNSGFMQKLCQFSVPQDTIPANSSLISASSLTGAVLVGTSFEQQHRVLVVPKFIDLLPATSHLAASAVTPLQDHDHCQIFLTSPCFWVSWSPDGALAAVAVVSGDVLVFSAQDLLVQRTMQPVFQFHQANIRQIEWSSCSSSLYVIDSSRRLSVRSLGAGASNAVELQTDATAIATEGDLVVYGQGISRKPTLCICKYDGQMRTLLTHSVSVPENWSCIIDSIAFIGPTALVLELLAVNENGGQEGSPSDEVFFSVIVLDDASQPTAVTHDMLSPERFHNKFQPIASQHAGGAPKGSRSPLSGPFMTAAAFPSSFPAAVACSSLLNELHFLHLFLKPIEDDESQLEWQVVLNAIDAMQLNLPGAEQSGTHVPNYVIGTAPFSSKRGVTVHHTLDGIPPAEDTPQVLFLMSGGQLVVASIGVFQPAQLHSSVIQTPSPAPPVPFSTAPQVLASFPHPEHNPASAAVLNPGEKNSEWEEEDDLEDASDPDYLPEGGEEISDDDDDDDDVNEEEGSGSNTAEIESSVTPSELPSELPSDPRVYQDADAAELAATIQGLHVLPSEELDDGESEWNDENVEDMENATPAQHRFSSGSQLQPLEPAAVPHGGHSSARVRESSQQGSSSSQSPLQPMALPHPALPHPGSQQEPFPLTSARTTVPDNVPETPESSEHDSAFTASSQSPGVPRMSPSLSPAAGAAAGSALVTASASLAPMLQLPTTLTAVSPAASPFPSTARTIWDRVSSPSGAPPGPLAAPAALTGAPFGTRPAGTPLALTEPDFEAPAFASDANELQGPIVSLNGGLAGPQHRPRPSLGSEGSTAASAPVPQSAEPHTSGPSAISRGCAAGSSSIEPEFLDDTVDVSVMGDGIPSEPAEPAILMSAAPDLNQDLPVHKQQASIVTQLERQLQKLPAAPGAATGSTATDSKKMFEAELDSIRHLLTEVRTAVQVSATCGLQPSDHEQVRTRGEEVKAVGEWCHQEGGELINHLTLHAKGCLRKLDAVQDMLKAQEDQQDNDAGSADSVDYDDGELPLRDIEKPKRIIEVVYVKALELETTINEHLADLTAAGDAAQAAKQRKFVHMNGACSAQEDPFTAATELQQAMKILEQRLLNQRSLLRKYLSPGPDMNPSQPSLSPFRAFPSPNGATFTPITPSIRPVGSSGGLPTPQLAGSNSATRLATPLSQTQVSTPSQRQFTSPWLAQAAKTGDVFSPAFVSAQRRSATPPSGLSPPPGVGKGDVSRTMPPNPTYVGHANLIRDMISRSSYKKVVETSEESPEISNLSRIMKRAAYQAQARCAQTVEPKLSPLQSRVPKSTRSTQKAPAAATMQPVSSVTATAPSSTHTRHATTTPSAPMVGEFGSSTSTPSAALARVSATPNEMSLLPNSSLVSTSLAQGGSAEGRLPAAANSAVLRQKQKHPPGAGQEPSHGAGSSMQSSASAAFSAALDTASNTGALVPKARKSQFTGAASAFEVPAQASSLDAPAAVSVLGAPTTTGAFGVPATTSLFNSTPPSSTLAQAPNSINTSTAPLLPDSTAPSLLFGSYPQASAAASREAPSFVRPFGVDASSSLGASTTSAAPSDSMFSLSKATQSLFSPAAKRQADASSSPFSSMPFDGTQATLQPPPSVALESPASGLVSSPPSTTSTAAPAVISAADVTGSSSALPSASSLSAPSSAAQLSQEVVDSTGESGAVVAQGSVDTIVSTTPLPAAVPDSRPDISPQRGLTPGSGATSGTAAAPVFGGLSLGTSQTSAAAAPAPAAAHPSSLPATAATLSTPPAFSVGPLAPAHNTSTTAGASTFNSTSDLFGALQSVAQDAAPTSAPISSSGGTAPAAVLSPAAPAAASSSPFLFPPQAAQGSASAATTQPALLFPSAPSDVTASTAPAASSSSNIFGATTLPSSQPTTTANIFGASLAPSNSQSSSLGVGSLTSSLGSATLFGANNSFIIAPSATPAAASPFSQTASIFGAQGAPSASTGGTFTGAFGSAAPQPTSLFPAFGNAAAPASTAPFATALASDDSTGGMFSSFGGNSGVSAFAGGFNTSTSPHSATAAPAATPSLAPSFGQPAQLGNSITSPAFGTSATPGFGQPPQLGNSMIGGTSTPSSGFGFGQVAQPQSAFGASFGAPQAPQAPLASTPTSTAPAFGAAFANTAGGGGGGFAALSQNASSAAFSGGGGFAALGGGGASSGSFGSGFAFGGGSTFAGNSAFGGSPSPFGQAASPFPPAFSSSAASSGVNAGMYAPRR